MPTINNAMYIGLSGLKASQMGLNVAGQNIANVNTEGYTRQKIVLEANRPIIINKGVFGTGVNLAEVSRTRDAFIDRQFRNENALQGDLDKQAQSLELIEGVINEPSDTGLSNAIKNFFNSLQDLSTNPESSSVRTTVREQGRALARMFNQVHSQLDKIKDNKNFEIIDDVAEVNSILERVASLNVEIGKTEALGRQANDLRDSRDLLLDKLSGLVDMTTSEDPNNGSVVVSINGQAFVVQSEVLKLKTEAENINGTEKVRVLNPTNNVEMKFSSGELNGLIEVRDRIVPELQGKLDELAKSIIDNVNTIHRKGYGLQGSRETPPTGINFFDGDDAASIQLSFDIENDPGNIAASSNGEPGDNSNSLAIAQLRNTRVLNNNTFTFEDYLGGMISTFGLETVSVKERLDNQEKLTEHLQNTRESLSGVNLDEELTNLVVFQKAFGANARILTTVNEMMDIVINLGKY
ncbi:flagellar hook-associated protein FlgK [bacterium]|nr:flagellar hook-associated protein FlgK [bacterium]